jgi:hypothetical protein
MKHLKYINESNKSDIIDYIKFCFLDILDDDRFECETNIKENTFRVKISFITPRASGNPFTTPWETNIEDLKENNDIMSELYSDIETSINRLLDKFSIDTGDKYHLFYPTIKINKVGTIYIYFNIEEREKTF